MDKSWWHFGTEGVGLTRFSQLCGSVHLVSTSRDICGSGVSAPHGSASARRQRSQDLVWAGEDNPCLATGYFGMGEVFDRFKSAPGRVAACLCAARAAGRQHNRAGASLRDMGSAGRISGGSQ